MIKRQNFNWDLLQKYVQNLPNQEHTQLLTAKDLAHDDKYYSFRFGEGDSDPNRPMGFPVATYRDNDGGLNVVQTRYNHHTCTAASSGSGKTQGVNLSLVFNAHPRQSYVILDPKGEILKVAYNRLCEIFGVENVLVMNLLHPSNTMIHFCPFTKFGYDLLNSRQKSNAKQKKMIYSSLDKIFRLLLPIEEGGEHDYWRREGRTFVYAILLGLFEDLTLSEDQVKQTGRCRTTPEMINFQTIIDVFQSFNWTDRNFNDGGFFSTRQKSSLAYKLASGTINNAGVTRANILDFSAQAIEAFSDPRVLAISKYNSFEIEELAKSPKCIIEVFDISHEASRDYLNFANTTFISTLLEISHQTASPLHTNVHFVLDEFATLGKSPVYPNLLATGRGSGLYLHMIVQSTEQLRSRYPNSWETMLDNCDVQLYLGSNSVVTAKHFLESLGVAVVPDPEAFLRGEFHVKPEPVVSLDYLLHRMKRGEGFVRVNNAQPLHTSFELYYKTPEYTAYPTVSPNQIKPQLTKVSGANSRYRFPKKRDSEEDDDYF